MRIQTNSSKCGILCRKNELEESMKKLAGEPRNPS